MIAFLIPTSAWAMPSKSASATLRVEGSAPWKRSICKKRRILSTGRRYGEPWGLFRTHVGIGQGTRHSLEAREAIRDRWVPTLPGGREGVMAGNKRILVVDDNKLIVGIGTTS